MSSVGFAEILIAGFTAIAIALVASFWPASRGHWSAPLLAMPGFLGGVALLGVVLGPHTDLWVKLLGMVPALLAAGSLVLWSRQRVVRKRQRSDDKPTSSP
jgi:hypothetical protein